MAVARRRCHWARSDFADQRMPKRVLGVRGEPHLIDQLRAQQVGEHRVDVQRREEVRPEARSDHRRRGQGLLGRGVQPVDARLDGCLHRGRHAHLGNIDLACVATALAGQHAALGQLAHDLLDEERVAGGACGDDRRQIADRGIRTD
jgi:hypothetical protein